MEQILKAWEFFSGKKTAIGAILKAVADILTVLGYTEVAQGVDHLGNTVLFTGLTHKGAKAIKK